MLTSVCVFCGSSVGANPAYRTAAQELGTAIARTGRRLVFGGGHVGLMGALADAALSVGGEVIGVIPQHLVDREVAHLNLTDLRIVPSMHERKALMSELSDGFVVLPGGIGTLEEFFEIWTWGQLGLHAKPYGLLNVESYFSPLLTFLDHAIEQRFIRREHREMLVVDTDARRLLARLDEHRSPMVAKWMDLETS